VSAVPALRSSLDCKDAESSLSAWLDRELDGDDRSVLEAHLGACAACRHKGELLARLKDALRQGALLQQGAPDHLVAAVRQGVRGQATKDAAWRATRTALVLAAVVAVCGGAGFAGWRFLPASTTGPQDALRPMLAESAERHTLDVPVDVASPDPARVQAFLKPRVGHDVIVPRLDAQGYGLLGGRIVDVMNRRAAQLVYMGGLGRRISVLAVPDATGELARLVAQGGGRRMGSAEGLAVEVYAQGGVVYAVVGDLAAERLTALVDAARPRSTTANAGVVQVRADLR
jgi:anti-sigma factor RsiW